MAKGGFKVMDSDIHVDEPHDLWDRYLEPRFRDRAPRFAAIDGSHSNGWQFEGKVFPAFFDRPERRRLGRIRREKALARHLETRRSGRELGAVALVLSNHPVNGRAWYDPAYEPLWAEAESLGVPVAFHGIQMAYQEHLGRRFMDNFVMAHAVAHPLEQMMALGSLLTGGVFERFPRLKAAFLEGSCSWVPWWLWTLDERVEKFGDDDRFHLTMRPSEYFRRNCWVSVD